MNTPDYHDHDHNRISAAVKRVSWGAILAGAVIGATLHFLLYLLGIGIGLETFEPGTGDDSLGGFGMAQGIWLVISGLIALFSAGWVAGRLAGMPRKVDGALHGAVTWSVATMFTLYFLASGIGTVFNGVQSVVAGGAGLAGQGIQAVAPEIADAAPEALDDIQQTVDLSEIRAEAERLASDVATSPGDAGEDLDAAIDRTFQGADLPTAADRDSLARVLSARTDLSQAEARETVDGWANQVQSLRGDIRQAAQTVRENAPDVARAAADRLGTAALWSFFALLLGAVAAIFGGVTGSPKDLPATAVREEARR